MGKPTVHDIAKEAGVTLATVDRVLNARPGVREMTVKRVQTAVQRLGYVRDLTAANLSRKRQYRFAFLMPDGPSQFVETLRAALREASDAHAADRMLVEVIAVPVHDPHAAARLLNGLDPKRFSGVAVMTAETPQVRDAIGRLKQAGLAVVALVSDIPSSQRDHFVGIDNVAAGRTAAVLMGRFLGERAGKVLIAASSMLARDSIERRLGFDSVMAERFPRICVLPSLESHDDPGRMAAVITAALCAHPDITGVYSLASGNPDLLAALRAAGRISGLVVIAHELTPVTCKGLIADEIDAVITQDVGHLVRSAMRILRARCDGRSIIESQERIRTDIVIRENLPSHEVGPRGRRKRGLP